VHVAVALADVVQLEDRVLTAADVLDPGRVNVYERWVSRAAVEAFRGSGPSDDQGAALLWASVAEYDVAGERFLT